MLHGNCMTGFAWVHPALCNEGCRTRRTYRLRQSTKDGRHVPAIAPGKIGRRTPRRSATVGARTCVRADHDLGTDRPKRYRPAVLLAWRIITAASSANSLLR